MKEKADKGSITKKPKLRDMVRIALNEMESKGVDLNIKNLRATGYFNGIPPKSLSNAFNKVLASREIKTKLLYTPATVQELTDMYNKKFTFSDISGDNEKSECGSITVEKCMGSLSFDNIPRNIRDYAIDKFGNIWGLVLCYYISKQGKHSGEDQDGEIPLPNSVLSACHPMGLSSFDFKGTIDSQYADQIMELYERGDCPYNVLIDISAAWNGRSISLLKVSPEILEQLHDPGELVNIYTGLPPMSSYDDKPSPVDDVEKFRLYLNKQEPDYSRPLSLIDCTRPMLNGTDERKLLRQLCSLYEASYQPKPFYKPGDKTVRLYAQGSSFQNMESELRDALFHGYYKLDLKYAQFAIVRFLWDVPGMDPYLDGSLWKTLVDGTGLPKEALKKLIYRICYGSKINQSIHDTTVDFQVSKELVNKAVQHPLIKLLFDSQNTQFAKVRETPVVIDAFGQELIRSNTKLRERDIRSALATQAQSYELKLLLPGLQLIMDKGLPVYVWMHDGFILGPEAEPELEAIRTLVNDEAYRLGIKTCLIVEGITSPIPIQYGLELSA